MKNYTENNSMEMKTEVETFVIEETAELIYDNEKLDQWNAHVEALGLRGQTKIVKPEKSPIPFMHMKAGLVAIFETLCPRMVDVAEYSATPIPVEILDLIALSVREKYFAKIQIWYDDKNPDPACIGITGHWYQPTWESDRDTSLDGKEFASHEEALSAGAKRAYFSETGKYLLGKWADVKQSFDELRERAKKRFIEEKGAELRKSIKEAQRGLDDLETDAIQRFS